MTVRLIPRLDIKGPNLVKGIHLEGLRVLGKPERFTNLLAWPNRRWHGESISRPGNHRRTMCV